MAYGARLLSGLRAKPSRGFKSRHLRRTSHRQPPREACPGEAAVQVQVDHPAVQACAPGAPETRCTNSQQSFPTGGCAERALCEKVSSPALAEMRTATVIIPCSRRLRSRSRLLQDRAVQTYEDRFGRSCGCSWPTLKVSDDLTRIAPTRHQQRTLMNRTRSAAKWVAGALAATALVLATTSAPASAISRLDNSPNQTINQRFDTGWG